MAKVSYDVGSFVNSRLMDLEEEIRNDWLQENGLDLEDEDVLDQWMDSEDRADFVSAIKGFFG